MYILMTTAKFVIHRQESTVWQHLVWYTLWCVFGMPDTDVYGSTARVKVRVTDLLESYHRHLRDRPAFWSQLYTCQVYVCTSNRCNVITI